MRTRTDADAECGEAATAVSAKLINEWHKKRSIYLFYPIKINWKNLLEQKLNYSHYFTFFSYFFFNRSLFAVWFGPCAAHVLLFFHLKL